MESQTHETTSTSEVRPFRFNVPEAELTELRRRINATKWPERETVADASQGVQLATTQALARYWATDYDWRTCEAKLNALPQFLTEIDGLDMHFIHVRSKHEHALPLIVTHGWPGSVIEHMRQWSTPEVLASFWNSRFPGQIPDHLVLADPLPTHTIDLEGHELVAVELGHTDTDKTTCLHVPAIGLVVTGDAAYNDVHLYLAESNAQTRPPRSRGKHQHKGERLCMHFRFRGLANHLTY